jgi:hypothetical protein
MKVRTQAFKPGGRKRNPSTIFSIFSIITPLFFAMRRAPACSRQAKRLAFLFYIYEPLEIFNLKKANIESTF